MVYSVLGTLMQNNDSVYIETLFDHYSLIISSIISESAINSPF